MANVGDILNDDEIFGDVVDALKGDIEQHKKQEELKTIIDKGTLGHKWTHKRVDKASDEVNTSSILNEKGEKTGKALGKYVINLYSTGISRMVKIRDVHKLKQDIENDLIIKDQMAGLGCLLVCTFSNLLASVLVLAHTINNLDLGDEQGHENEGYESD